MCVCVCKLNAEPLAAPLLPCNWLSVWLCACPQVTPKRTASLQTGMSTELTPWLRSTSSDASPSTCGGWWRLRQVSRHDLHPLPHKLFSAINTQRVYVVTYFLLVLQPFRQHSHHCFIVFCCRGYLCLLSCLIYYLYYIASSMYPLSFLVVVFFVYVVG